MKPKIAKKKFSPKQAQLVAKHLQHKPMTRKTTFAGGLVKRLADTDKDGK